MSYEEYCSACGKKIEHWQEKKTIHHNDGTGDWYEDQHKECPK